MRIPRDVYLQRLISRMHNGLIKVITGLRRSGKSYLLFTLFAEYLMRQGVSDDHLICIALDDEEYAALRDPNRLQVYLKERISNDADPYYVLIDEAQYAISKEEMRDKSNPIRLYRVLNGLLRKNNVDVYITGSNSKFLSNDVMTEFRGRGDEIHIAPLAFSEFFGAHGSNKFDAWEEYLLYGGLPHILEEKTDTAKTRYLSHLNAEIYLKDIQERYDIQNVAGMDALMKVLASHVGSLTNPQKISDTFVSSGIKGVSMPTIGNYLKYLQDAFVVQKAERYDIKGRKYLSTPAKYYYGDIGLRNALLNFRQFEQTHLMENAIYHELIYRGFNVDVGVVELRSSEGGRRVQKQLEVDFVANLGSRRYYLQSAFAVPDAKKMTQEQESLVHIPDSFKKLIILGSPSPLWHNEQGVTVMDIYDFLLNPDSLET